MKIERKHPLNKLRVLVGVSGSIAAVKTPILVSSLVQAGAEVKCVLSQSAEKLVSPISLANLSRNPCNTDQDQWSSKEAKPLHISLSEWADIVVIAPLTASSLCRWTHGLAEGLLASVLIACEKPVIAAAAMNTAMWNNNAVQKNWLSLQEDPNVIALSPSSGLLACNRFGDGRMVEPELIELAINSVCIQKNKKGCLQKDWNGLKLLVTAGPTQEYLDPARILTNTSSGWMGTMLAQAAKLRGAQVDLIHGPLQVNENWLEGLTTYSITNASEMQNLLKSLGKSADAIAMTAAIADLRIKDGGSSTKLDKDSLLVSITENLEKVPDLLAEFAREKAIGQKLLGFAALSGDDLNIQEVGAAKRLNKGCDLLFANPIDRPHQGFNSSSNGGFLLGPDGMTKSIPVTSKLDLAHQLLDALLALSPNISETI